MLKHCNFIFTFVKKAIPTHLGTNVKLGQMLGATSGCKSKIPKKSRTFLRTFDVKILQNIKSSHRWLCGCKWWPWGEKLFFSKCLYYIKPKHDVEKYIAKRKNEMRNTGKDGVALATTSIVK